MLIFIFKWRSGRCFRLPPAKRTMEKTFTFAALPNNPAQLSALPESACADPFATAALTAAVLCRYGDDPNATVSMLNVLRGPRPLSPFEVQFLRDRLAGKAYKPFSYFAGATPQNNYTPETPYRITVFDSPYSYQSEGYATLYLRSGGADSPRSVQLRRKGDQWMLWDQMLLSDIRTPAKDDPWA